MTMTPEERATKAGAAMWANDRASEWFGMTLEAVEPGRAVLSLTVEAQHTNGHGMCHGGVIFSLADSAFAFACNSHNRNAVAQHNMISFIAPGQLGDRLTATAEELSLQGRSGIYDVRVTRQTGEVVAEMRGCSRVIKGSLFDDPDAAET